jgi:hypothetical protein
MPPDLPSVRAPERHPRRAWPMHGAAEAVFGTPGRGPVLPRGPSSSKVGETQSGWQETRGL